MSETRNSSIVSSNVVPPFHASGDSPLVLVVDNQSVVADTIAKILLRSGFRAIAEYDMASALETASIAAPDLLITSVHLPQREGIELARSIKRAYPDCKILLFSRQASAAEVLSETCRADHCFASLNLSTSSRSLLSMVTDHLAMKSSRRGSSAFSAD